MLPVELAAAVAVVGAVGVLTKGPVATGVPGTLVNVALTPAERATDEERPWRCVSGSDRPTES